MPHFFMYNKFTINNILLKQTDISGTNNYRLRYGKVVKSVKPRKGKFRNILANTVCPLCGTHNYINFFSSAKKATVTREISDKVGHRSNSYNARKESLFPKLDVAALLIREALNAGLRMNYVLMDTLIHHKTAIKRVKTCT